MLSFELTEDFEEETVGRVLVFEGSGEGKNLAAIAAFFVQEVVAYVVDHVQKPLGRNDQLISQPECLSE